MNINFQAGSYTIKAVAALTWNWKDLLKKVFRRKNWMTNRNDTPFGGNY